MKLIIDIPDRTYDFIMGLNQHTFGSKYAYKDVQSDIVKAVKESKPYNPTGDLISREALKDAIETQDKFACLPDTKLVPFLMLNEPEKNYEPYVHLRDIRNAIDNAPTVAVNCKDCDGYEAGYSAGLKDAERPQGEYKTACNVLLSLEQIVRSSDGWEDSAVEAVHNAVQTAIKCMHDRPKGEWIHYLGCGIGKAVCSECGQVGETKKYCGNCGVRMKGDKE